MVLIDALYINNGGGKTMLDYLNSKYKKELKYFYFISYGNPDKRIDISKDYPLTSDKAFYDYDNIANKWVLPKIDFENSIFNLNLGQRTSQDLNPDLQDQKWLG